MRRIVYRERAFRSAFFPIAFASTAASIAGIPLVAPNFLRLLAVPGFALGVVALFVGLWAVLYAACRTFPVRIGPDGVRGYNGLGVHYEVPWSRMRSVAHWPGYLVVRHGAWGTGLSIPTWLEDNAGFREVVLAHAPAGNSLRTYLER